MFSRLHRRRSNLQDLGRLSKSCPSVDNPPDSDCDNDSSFGTDSVASTASSGGGKDADSSEDASPPVSPAEQRLARQSVRRARQREVQQLKNMEENKISMDDYLGKQEEFRSWLVEEQKKDDKKLSSPKRKTYFKMFVRLWNKRHLPAKYYEKRTNKHLNDNHVDSTPATVPETPSPMPSRPPLFTLVQDSPLLDPSIFPHCIDLSTDSVKATPSPFSTFGKAEGGSDFTPIFSFAKDALQRRKNVGRKRSLSVSDKENVLKFARPGTAAVAQVGQTACISPHIKMASACEGTTALATLPRTRSRSDMKVTPVDSPRCPRDPFPEGLQQDKPASSSSLQYCETADALSSDYAELPFADDSPAVYATSGNSFRSLFKSQSGCPNRRRSHSLDDIPTYAVPLRSGREKRSTDSETFSEEEGEKEKAQSPSPPPLPPKLFSLHEEGLNLPVSDGDRGKNEAGGKSALQSQNLWSKNIQEGDFSLQSRDSHSEEKPSGNFSQQNLHQICDKDLAVKNCEQAKHTAPSDSKTESDPKKQNKKPFKARLPWLKKLSSRRRSRSCEDLSPRVPPKSSLAEEKQKENLVSDFPLVQLERSPTLGRRGFPRPRRPACNDANANKASTLPAMQKSSDSNGHNTLPMMQKNTDPNWLKHNTLPEMQNLSGTAETESEKLTPSQFFSPNVDRIRQSMRRRSRSLEQIPSPVKQSPWHRSEFSTFRPSGQAESQKQGSGAGRNNQLVNSFSSTVSSTHSSGGHSGAKGVNLVQVVPQHAYSSKTQHGNPHYTDQLQATDSVDKARFHASSAASENKGQHGKTGEHPDKQTFPVPSTSDDRFEEPMEVDELDSSPKRFGQGKNSSKPKVDSTSQSHISETQQKPLSSVPQRSVKTPSQTHSSPKKSAYAILFPDSQPPSKAQNSPKKSAFAQLFPKSQPSPQANKQTAGAVHTSASSDANALAQQVSKASVTLQSPQTASASDRKPQASSLAPVDCLFPAQSMHNKNKQANADKPQNKTVEKFGTPVLLEQFTSSPRRPGMAKKAVTDSGTVKQASTNSSVPSSDRTARKEDLKEQGGSHKTGPAMRQDLTETVRSLQKTPSSKPIADADELNEATVLEKTQVSTPCKPDSDGVYGLNELNLESIQEKNQDNAQGEKFPDPFPTTKGADSHEPLQPKAARAYENLCHLPRPSELPTSQPVPATAVPERLRPTDSRNKSFRRRSRSVDAAPFRSTAFISLSPSNTSSPIHHEVHTVHRDRQDKESLRGEAAVVDIARSVSPVPALLFQPVNNTWVSSGDGGLLGEVFQELKKRDCVQRGEGVNDGKGEADVVSTEGSVPSSSLAASKEAAREKEDMQNNTVAVPSQTSAPSSQPKKADPKTGKAEPQAVKAERLIVKADCQTVFSTAVAGGSEVQQPQTTSSATTNNDASLLSNNEAVSSRAKQLRDTIIRQSSRRRSRSVGDVSTLQEGSSAAHSEDGASFSSLKAFWDRQKKEGGSGLKRTFSINRKPRESTQSDKGDSGAGSPKQVMPASGSTPKPRVPPKTPEKYRNHGQEDKGKTKEDEKAGTNNTYRQPSTPKEHAEQLPIKLSPFITVRRNSSLKSRDGEKESHSATPTDVQPATLATRSFPTETGSSQGPTEVKTSGPANPAADERQSASPSMKDNLSGSPKRRENLSPSNRENVKSKELSTYSVVETTPSPSKQKKPVPPPKPSPKPRTTPVLTRQQSSQNSPDEQPGFESSSSPVRRLSGRKRSQEFSKNDVPEKVIVQDKADASEDNLLVSSCNTVGEKLKRKVSPTLPAATVSVGEASRRQTGSTAESGSDADVEPGTKLQISSTQDEPISVEDQCIPVEHGIGYTDMNISAAVKTENNQQITPVSTSVKRSVSSVQSITPTTGWRGTRVQRVASSMTSTDGHNSGRFKVNSPFTVKRRSSGLGKVNPSSSIPPSAFQSGGWYKAKRVNVNSPSAAKRRSSGVGKVDSPTVKRRSSGVGKLNSPSTVRRRSSGKTKVHSPYPLKRRSSQRHDSVNLTREVTTTKTSTEVTIVKESRQTGEQVEEMVVETQTTRSTILTRQGSIRKLAHSHATGSTDAASTEPKEPTTSGPKETATAETERPSVVTRKVSTRETVTAETEKSSIVTRKGSVRQMAKMFTAVRRQSSGRKGTNVVAITRTNSARTGSSKSATPVVRTDSSRETKTQSLSREDQSLHRQQNLSKQEQILSRESGVESQSSAASTGRQSSSRLRSPAVNVSRQGSIQMKSHAVNAAAAFSPRAPTTSSQSSPKTPSNSIQLSPKVPSTHSNGEKRGANLARQGSMTLRSHDKNAARQSSLKAPPNSSQINPSAPCSPGTKLAWQESMQQNSPAASVSRQGSFRLGSPAVSEEMQNLARQVALKATERRQSIAKRAAVRSSPVRRRSSGRRSSGSFARRDVNAPEQAENRNASKQNSNKEEQSDREETSRSGPVTRNNSNIETTRRPRGSKRRSDKFSGLPDNAEPQSSNEDNTRSRKVRRTGSNIRQNSDHDDSFESQTSHSGRDRTPSRAGSFRNKTKPPQSPTFLRITRHLHVEEREDAGDNFSNENEHDTDLQQASTHEADALKSKAARQIFGQNSKGTRSVKARDGDLETDIDSCTDDFQPSASSIPTCNTLNTMV